MPMLNLWLNLYYPVLVIEYPGVVGRRASPPWDPFWSCCWISVFAASASYVLLVVWIGVKGLLWAFARIKAVLCCPPPHFSSLKEHRGFLERFLTHYKSRSCTNLLLCNSCTLLPVFLTIIIILNFHNNKASS